MKSGDLILFEGEHYWFSELIEFATRSKFSHCGIFLIYDNKEYLLESGYEKIDGHVSWGVQLTPWDYITSSYDGIIYYREIKSEEDLSKPIYSSYNKLKNLPYDINMFHFIRAFLGVHIGNCQETHSFFCSALASCVYSQCEIFSHDIQWDLVSPKMLSTIQAQYPFSFSETKPLK